jgi:hypothetical protein
VISNSKLIKNDVPNYGINRQKIILNSPITILSMFLIAVEFAHTIEAVFFLLGLRGFLWVWIMGSQNVMGSCHGSNTSEVPLSGLWRTGSQK